MALAGTKVYSIETGFVVEIRNPSFFRHPAYWTIVIRNDNANCDWQYCHLDSDYIFVSIGQEIEIYDSIARIYDWPKPNDFDHLHLTRADITGCAIANPLELLAPNSDNHPPIFTSFPAPHGNDCFAFCKDDASVYYRNADSLYGDVDIVCRIADLFLPGLPNSVWDTLSPYKITYQIRENKTGKIVVGPTEVLHFNGSLPPDALIHQIYKNNGVCNSEGNYNKRAFFYILTNAELNGCWRTTDFVNGEYWIEVNAYDHTLNHSYCNRLVKVRNRHDVGVEGIISPPQGMIYKNVPITPKATIKNYGNFNETFKVCFQITDSMNAQVYYMEQNISLLAGHVLEINFPSWIPTNGGTHRAYCYTLLANDENPSNNVAINQFFVIEEGGGSGSNEDGLRADEDFNNSPGPGQICTPNDPCGYCCICAGHSHRCCLCGGPCPGCCVCSNSCDGCCACEGRRTIWPPAGWRVFFQLASFSHLLASKNWVALGD